LAKQKTRLHANISPSQYGHINTSAGRQGLGYRYYVTQHAAGAELYIDRGEDRDEENKRIFDFLHGHKDEIEGTFVGPLEWDRLERRRGCRIRKSITAGGYRD